MHPVNPASPRSSSKNLSKGIEAWRPIYPTFAFARPAGRIFPPSSQSWGIGAGMIEFAISEAKGRGIKRVALTSNAIRTDAHRFCERLGFKPSHMGFKMTLK
ncbi:acetyltransferase [Rhizobium leguminosarum bv. trifolii CB782]|uniref:GNAT family N-acetyltransferase n=1 Tax=Rhizobium hidalgonense TaxID=1538159 RepID=UPI0003E2D361|nr:acetyltransferase [Rhizobium leguminosarum bv. trifolii CB782]